MGWPVVLFSNIKGLSWFDIGGYSAYNAPSSVLQLLGVSNIVKRILLLFCITASSLFLPAFALAEPAQALLNELVRPHLALLPPEKTATNVTSSLEELLHEKRSSTQLAELFTLDEMKDQGDELAELRLPDDLPASDIPLELNSQVEYFINQFQTRAKASFSRWLTRSARYIPMMKELLKKEKLPEDLVYVAMIESGFTIHARSVANAVGPWQFMSATGRRYSLRIDQWVDERKDPVKATVAAALYLKDLYTMFNGDWYLATAGYNAGENKIIRAMDRYNTNDFWELTKGSYLKRETKEYVPKLLAAAIVAKDPERYGFASAVAVPAIEYDKVNIQSRTDLELVARLTGTTYQSIRELNPSLRHWSTPPNYPDFELKIPKGTRERFEAELAKIPEGERFTEKTLYTRYNATRKDSIKSVAKRFGISPGELSELNGLGKKDRIAGRSLIVPARQSVDFAIEGHQSKNSDIRYYTVRKGDTIASLSRKFKVSAKLLHSWNNLKSQTVLKPGKRLIVAKSEKDTKGKA